MSMDDDDDGRDRRRRRDADLDELLRLADELEYRPKPPPAYILPAHPRFARLADKASDEERDAWIDRMRNRFGGEW